MAQKKPAQEEAVEVEGKNDPVHKVRVGGGIEITVWDNGKGDRPLYAFELVRTYKTKDGFAKTNKYWCDHLLFLSAAALRAHNWCLDQQDAARADDAKSK